MVSSHNVVANQSSTMFDNLTSQAVSDRPIRKTSFQLGGLMATYTALYYLRLDLSRVDHELNSSGSGKYSTRSDFSFDTNYRYFNWGHVYTGVTYHQLARSNGLGFWAGFGFNQLGSALWEYGVEFREVFSIGDQILTGFGGSTMGEVFFQIAPLLKASKNWHWGSYFLSPFSGINKTPPVNPFYLHGYFRWHLGVSNRTDLDATYKTVSLGFNSERDRIGQSSGNNMVAMSQLHASIDVTEKSQYDFATLATVIFNGLVENTNRSRYKKWLIGLASAVEYESRDYNSHEDWFGTINLLGLAMVYDNKQGAWHYRLQTEAYGDFAMINALALQKLDDEVGIRGIRAVTESLGYYYALGYTVKAQFKLSRKQTHLSYLFSWHSYDSIDRYNRFEQEQTKFYNMKDSLLRQTISLRHVFNDFSVGLRFSNISRNGEISDKDSAFRVSEQVDENQLELFFEYEI